MLSARNQLTGKIKSLDLGDLMAEVVVKIGKFEVASTITRQSAQRMSLAKGQVVTVVIKASDVMILKE